MQIINYVRARVFNSSYAALDLARHNPKYSEFAKKIVSLKQSNADCDLKVSHSDAKKYSELKYKLNKYGFVLRQLSSITNRFNVALPDNINNRREHSQITNSAAKTTKVGLHNYANNLPRLKVEKINGNNYEYFSPYNNKPSKFIITQINEKPI